MEAGVRQARTYKCVRYAIFCLKRCWIAYLVGLLVVGVFVLDFHGRYNLEISESGRPLRSEGSLAAPLSTRREGVQHRPPRPRQRAAAAQQACSRPRRPVSDTRSRHRSPFLVDELHNFTYCFHPKAASSYLLHYMFELNGRGVDTFETNHEVHAAAMPRWGAAKNASPQRLSRHYKFQVVRHPFHRFVSSYSNKAVEEDYFAKRHMLTFIRKNEGLVKFLRRNIPITLWEINGVSTVINTVKDLDIYLRNYDVEASKRKNIPEKGSHVSFGQFVQYALMQGGILRCRDDPDCLDDVDVHIQPQWMQCDPCALEYDAILKVESLSDDMNYLREVLHLPDLDHVITEHLDKRAARLAQRSRDKTEASAQRGGRGKRAVASPARELAGEKTAGEGREESAGEGEKKGRENDGEKGAEKGGGVADKKGNEKNEDMDSEKGGERIGEKGGEQGKEKGEKKGVKKNNVSGGEKDGDKVGGKGREKAVEKGGVKGGEEGGERAGQEGGQNIGERRDGNDDKKGGNNEGENGAEKGTEEDGEKGREKGEENGGEKVREKGGGAGVRINSSGPRDVASLLAELSPLELTLLYTAYRLDFEVYDYELPKLQGRFDD